MKILPMLAETAKAPAGDVIDALLASIGMVASRTGG